MLLVILEVLVILIRLVMIDDGATESLSGAVLVFAMIAPVKYVVMLSCCLLDGEADVD